MIRDVLSNLGGVGIYGVISICLFFATFLGVLVWAARLRRPWLDAMARLPIEPEEGAPEVSKADPEKEP